MNPSQKFKVRYQWFDDDQRLMQLILLDDWNWRDYHAGARAMSFTLMTHSHVHVLIDFGQSTRPTLPHGWYTHMRSFGKKLSPALSGHAIMLNFPPDEYESLQTQGQLNTVNSFNAIDGFVFFADDKSAIPAIIQHLDTL